MLISGFSFASLLMLLAQLLDNTTHSVASTGSEAIQGAVIINTRQLLVQSFLNE